MRIKIVLAIAGGVGIIQQICGVNRNYWSGYKGVKN
jgi:hypothetical protein